MPTHLADCYLPRIQ